jgi:hypothetical protein
MIPHVILFACYAVFWFLIRRDMANRPGVSRAIWIPTLWVGIIASRPLSMWLGFGGGEDTMEGSPMDRLFFFAMIMSSFYVLSRRGLLWQSVIAKSWPVFLFYGFLLVSVLWANSSLTSFKRWFKEFGNIVVLLVILTEQNPSQAIRAVFVRCGYVLIPLSYVFLRWFPTIGRQYSRHSGMMEATGVACQKNSLGAMILVCGLLIVWDWFEDKNNPALTRRQKRFDAFLRSFVLAVGVYLLSVCDSKTSIVCLAISAGILTATRSTYVHQRLGMLGKFALGFAICFYILDSAFNIRESILTSLGRDATFTGRTDVWAVLLSLKTDRLFGTGFMSFWDDRYYQNQLPDWVAFSAHNGYLEIFIAGGWIGVFFLIVMLLGTSVKINDALRWGGDYAVFRFAVLTVTFIANFTESNFGEMTPVGFLFLLIAIGYADTRYATSKVPRPVAAPAARSFMPRRA